MKKLFSFLLLLFLFLSFPSYAHADTNFQTSYTVTYTVKTTGSTHVNFAVQMKNLTDKYYASSYTLKLGFQNISNIRASDLDGAIAPDVKQTADGEEIAITFNHHVAGKNTVLPFTLSFDTTDIASLDGAIWEVNIPGLANQDDFAAFTVHVLVPPSFGNPTYIKPNVPSNNLTFTKDALGKSGISLAFGQKQAYTFSLIYHLQNKELFPVNQTIALPPDTSYQHVEIANLTPKPDIVKQDADGNWLATYSLVSGQKQTVSATGTVFVFLTPEKQLLSAEDQQRYTKPLQYWEANDTNIQKIAQQLKTPEAIFQYVVKTLHYDFSRVSTKQKRLGGAAVLQQPDSAVCLEFTDLFISLARAAGIPAREVDGYAYTKNTKERPLSLIQDILHAWPEYYDANQEAWIMVDPTWQNTTGGIDYFNTFDFDHVAFVMKGINSNYPIPAGGYKLPGQEKEKDVTISFASSTQEQTPQMSANVDMPEMLLPGFPVAGSLILTNTGSSLFPSQNITIMSSLGSSREITVTTPNVLPFGSVTVPFSFGRSDLLTNAKDNITIQIAGKTVSKTVMISLFSRQFFIIIGGIILGLFCISILIITTKPWRLFISRQKRENNLRG